MDKAELQELRKRFSGAEVRIVASDKVNLTLLGEDGVTYCERPDCTWQPVGEADVEGAVRYQGTTHHDYGIHLKPVYVMRNGVWTHVFTGRPEHP